MKIPYLVIIGAAALALVGCGKPEDTTAAANGPRTFALTANDTMKYSLTRLEVSAGEVVRVTLTNAGTLPREAMGHNWTLLKKDADPAAFANAAVAHRDSDYFPADQAGEVIAHTKLLGPRQSDTIEFTAPSEPGEYPFLCTFPGHFVSGMKGVLVVH
jgi:azurin